LERLAGCGGGVFLNGCGVLFRASPKTPFLRLKADKQRSWKFKKPVPLEPKQQALFPAAGVVQQGICRNGNIRGLPPPPLFKNTKSILHCI
jgi:hypothetical protein